MVGYGAKLYNTTLANIPTLNCKFAKLLEENSGDRGTNTTDHPLVE